jgi:hypothetical protein
MSNLFYHAMDDSDLLRQHIALAPIGVIVTPENIHSCSAIPFQPAKPGRVIMGLVVDDNGTACSFLKIVLRGSSDATP